MHFVLKATRNVLLIGAALSLSAVTATAAQSLPSPDGFPQRQVTIVSPFPPGGGNDTISRLVASELAQIIGQPVIVENRAGAGGNVGTASAAKAQPDGHTVLTSQTSIIGVNPVLYQNAGFDPSSDLEPLTQLTSAPVIFVVRTDSPFQSINDLLASAREKPGSVTFGTPGNGTLSHLTTTRLANQEKVELTHIPYRGASPALTDLVGGQIDMVVTSPSSAAGLVSGGKLRALAATNPDLLGVFEGVPTLEQAGIKNMVVSDWYGSFVPKGTPPEIVEYLSAAIRQALNSPELQAKVNAGGSKVVGSPRGDFVLTVQKEIDDWGDVVRQSGLKVD